MDSNVCAADLPLFQKKALRDILGMEIYLTEAAGIPSSMVLQAYLKLAKTVWLAKSYLKDYDLQVCATHHGWENCATIFYESERALLPRLDKLVGEVKSLPLKFRIPVLFERLLHSIENSRDEFESRIEDMALIKSGGVEALQELADTLDRSSSKLKDWRQSMPFLQ